MPCKAPQTQSNQTMNPMTSTRSETSTNSAGTPFGQQLAEHHNYLLRFARLQLRNDAWAEDAVSETVLAALAKPQAFGNRSQLKTCQTPADWGNPVEQITSRQFFEVLDACANKLPATQGRLFLMREWLELSSEEICKEMSLTPTNLYVQLHRARLRLRECLELNWFASPHTKANAN